MNDAALDPVPAADPDLPTRRCPRRWPWVLTAFVFAIAAAAAGAAAWHNYATGWAWQERAQAEDARADAAEEVAFDERRRADEATQLVEELQEQLLASESDVAGLESRLTALASEKATVEDEREVVVGERDALVELTGRTGSVGAALDDCIDTHFGVTRDIIAAFNAGDADLDRLNARLRRVTDLCEAARTDYAGLEAILDDVTRR